MLIHLAAAVTGPEDAQFASTVVGTERLLGAMAQTGCRRVVLASHHIQMDQRSREPLHRREKAVLQVSCTWRHGEVALACRRASVRGWVPRKTHPMLQIVDRPGPPVVRRPCAVRSARSCRRATRYSSLAFCSSATTGWASGGGTGRDAW